VCQQGAVQIGSVDGIANGPLQQVIHDLVRHGQGHVFLGLFRGRSQVGGHHDLIEGEKGIVRGRFLGEDIQGRSRNDSRPNGLIEGLFVHHSSPGAIEDEDPLLHLLEGFFVEDASGLGGHGSVNGDIIGAGEEFIQADPLDAHLVDHLGADVRIVGNDLHLESQGTIGHNPTDASDPDDAQDLVKDLLALKTLLLPLSRFEGMHRLGNVSGHGKQHGYGVFRRGDHVAVGGVHHHDASLGCRLHVHVVQADSRPGHHLQFLGRIDHVGANLRCAANHQSVVILDHSAKFFMAEARVHVHPEFGNTLQLFDADLRQVVTD